jgi:pimeloyl-ACP methyl ester carboxylesterase
MARPACSPPAWSRVNAVSAAKASRQRSRVPATAPIVHVRRAYVDSRFGQLHLTTAFPSGGGFDELTPLVCLHQSPASGRVFAKLLPLLGRDRSVYAVDTPGFGQSDAPRTQPSIEDYAAAMGDFLDHMRLRTADVLGYHTGSAIGTQLALDRPQQVRRLVLIGTPLFTPAEREAFLARPWPLPPRDDGSHVVEEWRRTLERRGPGVSIVELTASFAEKLRNGERAWWGASAAISYPMQERLPRIKQPTLVLRPHDDLWENTLRVRKLLPHAPILDLPDVGFGLFDMAPVEIAGYIREFLDKLEI